LLQDATPPGNHVALLLDNKLFNIKADGDTGSVDIKLAEANVLSMNIKQKARAVFSLDHLNNILKSAEIPSVVSISLRQDAPLKVEYAIGDGRVLYYLAPRIESV